MHGEYVLSDVPPGEYHVTAAERGFKDTLPTLLEMHADEQVRIDMTLEVPFGDAGGVMLASTGGPLRRNRTFFFASYDGAI